MYAPDQPVYLAEFAIAAICRSDSRLSIWGRTSTTAVVHIARKSYRRSPIIIPIVWEAGCLLKPSFATVDVEVTLMETLEVISKIRMVFPYRDIDEAAQLTETRGIALLRR